MSTGQVLLAVAAIVAAAGAIRFRRRLGRERTGLLLVAAALAGVVASGVLPDVPNIEELIEDVGRTLGDWTYLLVGGLAFLETGAFVGLVAPGEFTVIFGGVVAGQGEISLELLLGIVWASAWLGDTTSFWIGRRLGRTFLLRHGPKVKIDHKRLEQVERYFNRHGGKTIVIGRFVGLVRALAPFVAGTSRMSYRTFAPYSVVGTGLWAATFTLLGYFFWRSFSEVAEIAGRASIAFGFLVGAIVLAIVAYRRLRDPADRARAKAWLDEQAERPALRPVARVARPVWRRTVAPVWRYVLRPVWRLAAPRLRFLLRRLTPGNLGIEFTTSVAAAAVGLYSFGLYAVIVDDDPGPTGLDDRAAELARETRVDSVVDVVKVVTDLGSAPVVFSLVAVAALLLAWRRRPLDAATLVIGIALVYAAVKIGKGSLDRPRPEDALASSEGSSYPSGHAAYATAYVALAVAARRALPNLITRATLVVVALVLTAALGASRVYLGVHHGSDVAGGWGLGFGVFAACAAIALLVGHIRQNARAARPGEAPRTEAAG